MTTVSVTPSLSLFDIPQNCVATAEYIFRAFTGLILTYQDDEFFVVDSKSESKYDQDFAMLDLDLILVDDVPTEMVRNPDNDGRPFPEVYYLEVRWGDHKRHVVVYSDGRLFDSYHDELDGTGQAIGHGLRIQQLSDYDRMMFDSVRSSDDRFWEAFIRLCVPTMLQESVVDPVLVRCVRSWQGEAFRKSQPISGQ